jgi:hypothetical protein
MLILSEPAARKNKTAANNSFGGGFIKAMDS